MNQQIRDLEEMFPATLSGKYMVQNMQIKDHINDPTSMF